MDAFTAKIITDNLLTFESFKNKISKQSVTVKCVWDSITSAMGKGEYEVLIYDYLTKGILLALKNAKFEVRKNSVDRVCYIISWKNAIKN